MAKALVLSFSRNNPISIGHQKLFQAVKKIGQQKNATVKCYMSQTHNDKKDPIPHEQKVNLAKQLMPDLASQFVIDKSVRSVIDVLKVNSNKDVDLYFVAGSDRVPEYTTLLNKYNGKDYTYKTITVVSAGERDPDAEGVAGISGTKMRKFAVDGDFNAFKQGSPQGAPEAVVKKMYDIVRDNLKSSIRESKAFYGISGVMYYSGGEHTDSRGNHFDYWHGPVQEAIEFSFKHGYVFEQLVESKFDISNARSFTIKEAERKTVKKKIKLGAKNDVVMNPEFTNYGKVKK